MQVTLNMSPGVGADSACPVVIGHVGIGSRLGSHRAVLRTATVAVNLSAEIRAAAHKGAGHFSKALLVFDSSLNALSFLLGQLCVVRRSCGASVKTSRSSRCILGTLPQPVLLLMHCVVESKKR